MINSLMEDDISMETVEATDIKSEPVVTYCLGVSLILRKIFQNFTTTELLELSLVNKQWSYEARSLLRDRGTVTTTVNKTKKCQDLDLVAFASDLLRTKEITKVLPFSGLTIQLGGLNCKRSHGDGSLESATPLLDLACQDILDQLTWKHLSIKFDWHWTEELINCPGFLLVKKILEQAGPVLEELALGLPPKRGDFIQEFIESCCSSLPSLKILKFQDMTTEDYTNLIKLLVSRAPNLQVLHTNGRVDLHGNLLEGSSAVHVTDFPFSPFLNEIPDDTGPLRMTRMVFEDVCEDLVVERVNRVTIGLLEASRTTLSSMCIDALFLAPLTTYGISLENVRTLEINFELQKLASMHPHVLRLVKYFDFTRTFPNLDEIKVNCCSNYNIRRDEVDEMIGQGNAAFREPTPDRAINIKSLSVRSSRKIKDSTGRFLAQMFPNVEEIYMTATRFPFRRIWECLHSLQMLNVTDVSDRGFVKNLDSVFCGIFPEEVALLREQDEDYLKAVNIVPVMPSITCSKGLRNLNFFFGRALVSHTSKNDPTHLFSKVTVLIAFQRCPQLSINLYTKNKGRREALSHLRPYAAIFPVDEDSSSTEEVWPPSFLKAANSLDR